MTEMVKVRIDMDESWVWWPVTKFMPPEKLIEYLAEFEKEDDQELIDFVRNRETPTIEIPESLIAEYEEIKNRYWTVMDKFEQLYRVQQGLKPHDTSPVPDYKLLKT